MAVRDSFLRLADYAPAGISQRVREFINSVALIDDISSGVTSVSHADLTELDYASAGHTGFQAEITASSPLGLTLGGTGGNLYAPSYAGDALIYKPEGTLDDGELAQLEPPTGSGNFLRYNGADVYWETSPIGLDWGGTGTDLSATGPGIIWQPSAGGALVPISSLTFTDGLTVKRLSTATPGHYFTIRTADATGATDSGQLAFFTGDTEDGHPGRVWFYGGSSYNNNDGGDVVFGVEQPRVRGLAATYSLPQARLIVARGDSLRLQQAA